MDIRRRQPSNDIFNSILPEQDDRYTEIVFRRRPILNEVRYFKRVSYASDGSTR